MRNLVFSIDDATNFNEAQSGDLWNSSDLPRPFSQHPPGSEALAHLVGLFQHERDLLVDGKLGPNTLSELRVLRGTDPSAGEYAAGDLRDAWVDAALDEWKKVVLDIQSNVPEADKKTIEQYYRDIGWGWNLDNAGEPGYDEAESWCGVGQAWLARHRLGEFLGANGPVDVRLHSGVADTVMPSTHRLANKWAEVHPPTSEQPAPSDLQRGDLVTVGDNPPIGSHIALVLRVEGRELHTVECNAHGVLGNGKYGEGIVKRTHEVCETYGSHRREVEPRSLDEVHQTFRFGLPHFEGSAMPSVTV